MVYLSIYLTKSGCFYYLGNKWIQDFVFHDKTLSRFKTFIFVCLFSLFLFSNDSLILHFWWCCSIRNVFAIIQLNCSWRSRQCSVALELSHFPLRLSCWCSMLLMKTFFVVSPMYGSPRDQGQIGNKLGTRHVNIQH